jgi:hypothetical protein
LKRCRADLQTRKHRSPRISKEEAMKKLLIVVVVAIAALALAAPAFAWPVDLPWWHPATQFTAAGKAKAIDTANGKIVVRVQLASTGVAQFLGEDLTVTIKPETQILLRKGLGFKTIKLGEISLEDHVRVAGAIDRSEPGKPDYIAQRVIVHHPVPAEGLTQFACRGPVVSVDAVNSSMVIRLHLVTRALWEDLGTNYTFAVGADAKIFSVKDGVITPITLAEVSPGQRVTAQGVIDRSVPDAPVFTIKWMRVFPAPTPAL